MFYLAESEQVDRFKRIWYLSLMRVAKVQASLRIRAVSPNPSLLAHTSSESRGTFRQKTRSLAPLNGWACAVKICHDGICSKTQNRLPRLKCRDTMQLDTEFGCFIWQRANKCRDTMQLDTEFGCFIWQRANKCRDTM